MLKGHTHDLWFARKIGGLVWSATFATAVRGLGLGGACTEGRGGSYERGIRGGGYLPARSGRSFSFPSTVGDLMLHGCPGAHMGRWVAQVGGGCMRH